MSEPEVEFATRAYTKMIMHAAKYPHCAVNGLLLAKASNVKTNPNHLIFTDCIPLFHQTQGLTPMLEVAFTQIETRCQAAGLVIAGFYHANERLRDVSVDVFSQRIADKIADHSVNACLVTIDNKRLGMVMESHALIVQQHVDGKWRHKDKTQLVLEHDSDTLDCASALVQKKIQKDLVDFDNHLDDLTLDYLNVEVNMEIDNCL